MNEFEKLVLDDNKWPWFKDPEQSGDLDLIALQMVEKNTTEGFLAGTLIYHQQSEEFMRLLLEYNDLYIKAKLWPVELKLKRNNSVTFGRLREYLMQAVEFEHKKGLISILGLINKNRIDLVHRLSSIGSDDDVREKAEEIAHLYRQIFWYFDHAIEWFRKKLYEIHESPYWKELKNSKGH